MRYYIDKVNQYVEIFNTKTGFYARTGRINDDAWGRILKLEETDEENICLNLSLLFMNKKGLAKISNDDEDVFMRDFPQLIDIGIMGNCIHGKKGLCIKSGVQCYQNGLTNNKPNMGLDNFKKIIDQSKDKVFQVAVGGCGDVDQHENFEESLKYCVENRITPNFTSSGLGFTDEIAKVCKKYCGSVAISWYRQEHTLKAIDMLLKAGVKTNIHYVLGKNSIEEAIQRLNKNSFPAGINAIVFLLHKPVGLGQDSNCLTVDNPHVKEFYSLIDTKQFDFKIGFDSCNCSGIANFTKNIESESMDYCESGRHSAYIDAEMNMMPCSFANQDSSYFIDLKQHSIQDAWDSEIFENFRNHFKISCPDCKDRENCSGGCPIVNQTTLCNRPERTCK